MNNVNPLKRPDHHRQVHDALVLLRVLTLGGHSQLVISEVIAKAEYHLEQIAETATGR